MAGVESKTFHKMPTFNPKDMTFSQYIEDVYEIKSWGLKWENETKLRNLALVLRKYVVIATLIIKNHMTI